MAGNSETLAPKQEKVSIVVTCHGEAEDLEGMLHCLSMQRENVWGTHSVLGHPVCWMAGKKLEWPLEVIVCSDGVFNGKVDFKYTPGEYETFGLGGAVSQLIQCPKQGGVGHNTRGPGIEAASGAWIALTNADNYYVPGWLDRVVSAFEPDVGIIYWNIVHNAWRWGINDGVRLERGRIDLSALIVRAEIAKEVGFPWREYESDWTYIEACVALARKKKMRVVFIDEYLSVHS